LECVQYGDVIEPVLQSIGNLAETAFRALEQPHDEHDEESFYHTIAVRVSLSLLPSERALIVTCIQELMTINHHLLNAIGVGHSKVDIVRQCAAQFGVTSKITGAGGGGCMLLLLPRNAAELDLEALQNAMLEREVDCLACGLGVEGLTLHEA